MGRLNPSNRRNRNTPTVESRSLGVLPLYNRPGPLVKSQNGRDGPLGRLLSIAPCLPAVFSRHCTRYYTALASFSHAQGHTSGSKRSVMLYALSQ